MHTCRRPLAVLVLALPLAALGNEPTLIEGTPKADRLMGTNGPDRIEGGAGNDVIVAGGGDDELVPGPGRDSIEIGPGNDTIVLSRGDGVNTVVGFDDARGRRDVVRFGEGITPEEVRVYRQATQTLVLSFGRGDRVLVPRHFEEDGRSGYRIDAVEFDDGTVWEGDELRERATQGTDAADYLVGYTGNDELEGSPGNDTLYGGPGNDALKGGVGNDRAYGDEGNDVLEGGPGNDLLRGELGSDTYVYRRGDGLDTIQNFSRAGDVDVIRFEEHAKHEVSMSRRGNDLLLMLDRENKEGIRVAGFNSSAAYPITRIEFADDQTIELAEMQAQFPVAASRYAAHNRNATRGPVRTSAAQEAPPPPPPPVGRPIRMPLERIHEPTKPAEDAGQ